jgi:hypothetical protein
VAVEELAVKEALDADKQVREVNTSVKADKKEELTDSATALKKYRERLSNAYKVPSDKK